MKKLLSASLLVLSTQASALQLNDILHGLSLPQKTSNSYQCMESEIPFEVLHQCAVDLCGDPKTAPTSAVNDSNFDLYFDEAIKNKLPEVDELAKKNYLNKKTELQNLIKALRAKIQNNTLLDYSSWQDWSMEGMGETVFRTYVTVWIDLSKPISERIELKINIPENASKEVQEGIKEYANLKKIRAIKVPSEGMNDGLYSLEESKKLFQDFVGKFNSLLESEKDKTESFVKEHEEDIKNIREINLSKLDKSYEVGNAYSKLDELYNSLLTAVGRGDEIAPQLARCNEICKRGVKTFLDSYNFSKKLDDLEKKLETFTEQTAIEACEASFLVGEYKASDKEKFMALFPDIKVNFLNKVFKNYSSQSKQAFSNYLEKDLNLSFQNPYSEFGTNFLNDLKYFSERELNDYSSSSYSPTLISDLMQNRSYRKPDELIPEIDMCMNTPNSLWDAFSFQGQIEPKFDMDPARDNIQVSLFSCTFEQGGKDIISHEMGHALSYAFTKKKLSHESEEAYNKLRNCVTESYVEKEPEEPNPFSRPGDSIKTEEDTADVIGFIARREDNKIGQCGLLETNKEASSFINLSLDSVPHDLHSGSLLRIIREALYKGQEMSPACKTIIENNRDKYRFTPCI